MKINKQIIVSLLYLNCLISYSQTKEIKPIILPLIPLPNDVVLATDSFALSSQTKIVSFNNKFENELNYFNKFLKSNFDFELKIVSNIPAEGNYIVLTEPDFSAGFLENYNLDVNQNQILFQTEGGAGLFYGLQTLIELMPLQKSKEIKIPCVQIKDAPRYQWRGMHLDCSRHFFSIEEIKDGELK
jgi:hexosaminidase